VPLAVELFLNEFDDALLLVLDAGLLLPEAVQLGLPLCDFLAVGVHVQGSAEGVFVPHVQDGDHDVSAQVEEGLGGVQLEFPFVVLAFPVVQGVFDQVQNLPVVALLQSHLFKVALQLRFLFEHPLPALVNFLPLIVYAVLDKILVAAIFLGLERVVVGVEVVAALQGVGVDDAEFLVEDDACTALLADILVPVLGLHVLAGEDALLELEVDAVLGQHLGVQLAFHLLDELVDGVAEDEVAFEGWVCMQVEVHEQPLLFGVVFAELLDGEAGGLLLGVGGAVVAVEILVQGVHATVAAGYAVGVEHGDQDEDEVPAKEEGAHVLFVEEEFEDAVHAVAGRSFDGVDAG
jgi:hypothetical protein